MVTPPDCKSEAKSNCWFESNLLHHCLLLEQQENWYPHQTVNLARKHCWFKSSLLHHCLLLEQQENWYPHLTVNQEPKATVGSSPTCSTIIFWRYDREAYCTCLENKRRNEELRPWVQIPLSLPLIIKTFWRRGREDYCTCLENKRRDEELRPWVQIPPSPPPLFFGDMTERFIVLVLKTSDVMKSCVRGFKSHYLFQFKNKN